MSLLNVRLNPEDARMAAELRRAGVPISGLVREAIRREYERRLGPDRRPNRASLLVVEILASLPDPGDLPAREFSVADRGAVRRHISKKLAHRGA